MTTVGGGHVVSGLQDFILTHFINKNMQIYCGHKGEGYVGKIVECAHGVVTMEKDGQILYISCDKIECLKPL